MLLGSLFIINTAFGQCTVTVNATPLTQTICSGTAITQIVISVSPGATFSWSRTNSINVQGIPQNGNSSTISGTLINTQNTQQPTDFFILAVDGACQTQLTVRVNVNPKPTISITNPNQTICSGTALSTITFSNPNAVTGTTYSWTRTNTASITGVAASGSGTSISGTLSNTTNTQQTTVFSIFATANGCSSNVATATIVVNPVPTISATPSTLTICDLASTNIVVQNPNSVAGTTFSWTRNNTANVTGISSGTGSPIIVTLDNTRNNLQTTVFTILASANGCSSSTTSSITVNTTAAPTLSVNIPAQTICTGTPISNIIITSNASSINWTRDNTANITGINASGTSLTISGSLTNNTASSQATIFTITAGSGGCTNTAAASVTVNPIPVVTNQSATICSGTLFNIIPANGGGNTIPAGTTYTWGLPVSSPAGSITGGSAQATGQSSISQTLTNTTNSTATLTYTVTPGGTCAGSPFLAVVTVSPKPVILNQSSTICSGNAFTVSPLNGSGNIVPLGTTYTWTAPVSSPAGAVTGGSAQGTGQGSISQALTNVSGSAATLTYTVTPAVNGCAGDIFSVIVTVESAATISGPISVNQGSVGNSYTTETGKTSYNWTISAGGVITSGQNTNHVLVTWNTPGSQTISVSYTTGNGCPGTATQTVNVIPASTVNFGLTKSQSYPSPTAPGDLVTYTITYLNTSANTATNVIITDLLPPANLFTYTSSDHSGVFNPGVPSVVWNIGTVPSNGSGSVTVTGLWGISGSFYSYNPASNYTSTGSSISTITNTASIGSDQSSVLIAVVTASVPQTCGSVFPNGNNNFRQGEDKVVYYPVSIVNTGNIFDNFTLSVPSLVTSQTGSVLLLRILDINRNPISQSGWIAPGASFSFLLEMNGTSITNKPKDGDIFNISITSTSAVCGTTSSSTITTTTYNGSPSNLQDILVTKTASVGSYTVGNGPITYTIIMSNIGQSDATNVVLTDNLPANTGLPLAGEINQAGTLSGNTVTWPAITVPAGTTMPAYTVTIHPNCLSTPTLINTAVASLTGDINTANNTSSITIPVTYLQVSPTPSADNPIVCANNSVILSATGATGTETYRWYLTSTGGTPFATGSPVTSPVLTTTSTFYVSLYDPATQCESNRSPITIIVNPLPDPAGPITGPTSGCVNQISNYSVPAINNSTSYIWSYSGTGVSLTGSGNSINLDFSSTATSGTLSVFGRNICGDGTLSQIFINIYPPPTPIVIYHQ